MILKVDSNQIPKGFHKLQLIMYAFAEKEKNLKKIYASNNCLKTVLSMLYGPNQGI